MKAEIETSEAAALRGCRSKLGPAPSLRIPVTAGSRALLRRLRAAELLSWMDPTAGPIEATACTPAEPSRQSRFA